MIRRQGRFALGNESVPEEDGVNPMHYLPNLPDVMLVLAVALLVALISYWNVDVTTGASGGLDPARMQPVQGDIGEGGQTTSLSGEQYKEVGTVYQDIATGEMYLLSE
jgi:hypothetical protein